MGKAQPDAKWDYCAEQERGDKVPEIARYRGQFRGAVAGGRETEEPAAYSIASLE